MSIAKRIIVVVAAIVIVAILIAAVLSFWVFRGSFVKLEQETVERNASRVVNAVSNYIHDLDMDNEDWAAWDDTYAFARSGLWEDNYNDLSLHYIDRNLTDDMFLTQSLNLFAVIGLQGEIIYSECFDLMQEERIAVPEELKNIISSDFFISHPETQTATSGIVCFDGTPMLISSYPILTSAYKGPSTGTLIMGRFMDSDYLNKMSEILETSILMFQVDDPQMSEDFIEARAALLGTSTSYTKTFGDDYIAGYKLMNDVYGNPAIIFKVIRDRDIYRQGHTTAILIFSLFAFTSILCGLIFIQFARKTTLSRLTLLSHAVSNIGNSKDLSKRVSIKGKDELSKLAINVNEMLGKIEESQKQLAIQENIVRRILEYAPNIVVLVDDKVKIKIVNKAFCELFNVSEKEAIGKPLTDFVPAGDIFPLDSQISRTPGAILNMEYNFKVGDRQNLHFSTIITMSPEEYLLISRDITEERETLNKLYAAERLTSIGEMAAGIAHEINNPLTSIMMLSQMLENSDLPDGVKNDISVISSETKRAADIIKSLLEFARRNSPSRRPTQINKLIEDVIKLRSYEHTEKNIQVILRLNPNIPEIMTDSVQIKQVFLNIVMNAEHAISNINRQGRLQIESHTFEDQVIILFSDNGEGIAEENLKKIFQPFFTTKDVGSGTGLGLSLCYGIVKAHDGTIYAESQLGKSTTFVVKLPINAAEDDKGANTTK